MRGRRGLGWERRWRNLKGVERGGGRRVRRRRSGEGRGELGRASLTGWFL